MGLAIGSGVGEAIGLNVGEAAGKEVGEETHAVAPVAPLVDFPLGHDTQEPWPDDCWYWFTGQEEHDAAPSELYFPAAHDKQEVAPLELYVPAAHVRHVD